jgi:hypothetical protein
MPPDVWAAFLCITPKVVAPVTVANLRRGWAAVPLQNSKA